MSFLKSAINQVGRDFGKVISNQIFKDAHAAPIRMSGANPNGKSKKVKSEFEKALTFPLTQKPNTLLTKMSAAYIELKNEADEFLSDGYLSMDELKQLVELFNTFNRKASDITDLLELDEEKNSEEISKLTELVQKNKELFIKTLEIGLAAARNSIDSIENYKKEEKKGLSGLFGNSKIKKHNENVEEVKQGRISYINLLEEVLGKVNRLDS